MGVAAVVRTEAAAEYLARGDGRWLFCDQRDRGDKGDSDNHRCPFQSGQSGVAASAEASRPPRQQQRGGGGAKGPAIWDLLPGLVSELSRLPVSVLGADDLARLRVAYLLIRAAWREGRMAGASGVAKAGQERDEPFSVRDAVAASAASATNVGCKVDYVNSTAESGLKKEETKGGPSNNGAEGDLARFGTLSSVDNRLLVDVSHFSLSTGGRHVDGLGGTAGKGGQEDEEPWWGATAASVLPRALSEAAAKSASLTASRIRGSSWAHEVFVVREGSEKERWRPSKSGRGNL